MGATEHLGPYELRDELGRGAMARVWRAYDPKLEREVAIKEPLFDEKLSDDILIELAERFVKEGKAAGRLNHPGIVTIFAADVYDNRPAIVMELIDGLTLGEMIQAGAIDPITTLEILDQLLDAAGYAHSQGVVHRDIKPDNIFITSDGRVKLADFGIAHLDNNAQSSKTQIGTVLGTPGYMAPEQATGGVVDNRTDLFAIATIAYEMIMGFNPFGLGDSSDSTTLLYRIVHEAPPMLPDSVSAGLPADIRPAILTALNKNPYDRPLDAASFKAMLHGALTAALGLPQTQASAQVPGLGGIAAAYKNTLAAKQNKYLPYILVAAVGVAVIIALLLFAIGGSGVGYGAAGSANSLSGQVTSAAEATDKKADEEVAAKSEAAAAAKAEAEAKAKADQEAAAKAAEASAAEAAAREAEAKRAAAAAQQTQSNSNTLYVRASDFVTLREYPSTSSVAITRLNTGTAVQHIAPSGSSEWTQVSYNGSTGYVLTKFVSNNPNAPLVYDER